VLVLLKMLGLQIRPIEPVPKMKGHSGIHEHVSHFVHERLY
jgi:hypothetical protein